MNIKNKSLFLAGPGVVVTQFLATKVFAQGSNLNALGADTWIPSFFTDQTQTVPQIVTSIIQLMLIVAAVIAVIFIIWGGYQYISSSGDPEKAGKGRSTLINAIIGLVIIFVAYAVAGWVVGYLT